MNKSCNNVCVGYSAEVITPKLGLGMAGYGTEGRKATGVHDELYARALIISDGGRNFFILQNDLLCVDAAFAARAEGIAAKYGVEAGNVFCGAIHTHSGPTGLMSGGKPGDTVFGDYDAELCEGIFRAIEHCAANASANMSPARLRFGHTEIEGVGTNRNDPAKPCDKTLTALEFLREDGEKILLYSFSCHPTVLNKDNTQYSADWTLGVSRRAAGEYGMAMFLNGSAGDISTRFTRRAASFEEADRLGGLLYDGIALALGDKEYVDIENISAETHSHSIKLKSGDVSAMREKYSAYKKSLEDARKRGEKQLRLYESKVEGAAAALARAESLKGGELAFGFKILRINGLAFVMIPGELFSALSLRIRQEFGQNIVFCSYFGGYIGYIADSLAYTEETYEAMSSPFEPGGGEAFMDTVKAVL
jgi:hypothetical protein